MDIIKFKKDLDTYSNADILSIAKMYGFIAPMQDLRWLLAINHANKKQMPDVMTLINKHFPGAKITTSQNGDISVDYQCHDKHEMDISFSIWKDVVYIHLVTKCNEQSGTEMLTRIIDIARELNKNVSLADASTLYYGDDPDIGECLFSLTNLYILLYGQSWYNKFGFKSQDYDAELAHNKKVRSMKLSDYLDLLLQKRREHVIATETRVYAPLPAVFGAMQENQRKMLDKEYGGKENFIKHINKELDVELGKFRELALSIAKNSNMTVAEFAKQLYDSYISGKLNDCKNENVQFIVKFFDWSGKILKYNTKLTLSEHSQKNNMFPGGKHINELIFDKLDNSSLKNICQIKEFIDPCENEYYKRLKPLQEWLRTFGMNYSLDKIKNLVKLNLSYKKIKKLPDEIGYMSELQKLDLSGNQMSELPETIGNLSELQYLGLSGNKMSELPETIGNLSNLQYLRLCHNELRKLPESIGNLSNLQYLDLFHNSLDTLPESLGDLINLKELDISLNNLSVLPVSFIKLDKLKHVSLINNMVELKHQLPPHFQNKTLGVFEVI